MKAFALLLALALPAEANTFAPHRGFSTDIWTVWMNLSDRMADPQFAYPDYPATFTPQTLPDLAAQGFDTMRLTADPGPLLAAPDREARIAGLVARVQEAQAAGLQVILDLHAYPAPGEPEDTETILGSGWPAYLTLVGQVAKALAPLDPARTAFEPLNEPTIDCDPLRNGTPQRWPALLAQIHAAARQSAPDLPLILSGACWGGAWGLRALTPLDDPNVWWSFHSYEPFEFTHQGASWTGSELAFVQGLGFPPALTPDPAALVAGALDRAAHPSEWSAPLAPLATRDALQSLIQTYRASPEDAAVAPLRDALTWAQSHNIPASHLILGEFGALWRDETGPHDAASHARYLTAKRKAAEDMGIAWVVWSFSGAMAITDPGAKGPHLNPLTCKALGLNGCETPPSP